MADQAYLDIVNYDERVRPGDPLTIRVMLSNDYKIVSPDDPNYCFYAPGSGLKSYVEIENGNTGNTLVTTDWVCMPTNESTTLDITFRAPEQEGEHIIYANGYHQGTNEIFGVKFRRVVVDPDAPSTGSCLDNSYCPEGQECIDGKCRQEQEDGSGFGDWVLKHPVETALGTVGFAIVVDQLIGD